MTLVGEERRKGRKGKKGKTFSVQVGGWAGGEVDEAERKVSKWTGRVILS